MKKEKNIIWKTLILVLVISILTSVTIVGSAEEEYDLFLESKQVLTGILGSYFQEVETPFGLQVYIDNGVVTICDIENLFSMSAHKDAEGLVKFSADNSSSWDYSNKSINVPDYVGIDFIDNSQVPNEKIEIAQFLIANVLNGNLEINTPKNSYFEFHSGDISLIFPQIGLKVTGFRSYGAKIYFDVQLWLTSRPY